MDNKDLLAKISRKLDILIALSLRPGVDDMNLSEKIRFLAGFKIDNSEIATISGASKGTVEVVKSRAKGGRK